MISKWQAAYEMIRFSNYSFFNYDNHTGVIWLKDVKSNRLVTLSDDSLSDAELEEVTRNILYSYDHLRNLAGFDITQIRCFYLAGGKFSLKHRSDGVKIIHEGIDEPAGLMADPFFKLEVNNKKPKTDRVYQRRLFSGHPLETFMFKFTPMTYLLISLNLVIFLFALFNIYIRNDYMLVDRLAVSHAEIAGGEYYRLLTSAFLHIGFEHFLFNIFALYILGKIVETLYNHYKLLTLYVVTGVLSSLFSLMFLTDAVSFGASGAIYGLLGVVIVHLLLYRKIKARLLLQIGMIFIVVSLMTSIFSNVNHYAHIGGLVFGALSGILLNPNQFQKKWYFGTIGAFAAITITSFIILYTEEPVQAYDQEALDSIEAGDYDRALSYVNLTFGEEQESALTYHALALLYEQADEPEKAREYHDRSYEMNSGNERIIKARFIQLRKERRHDDISALIDQIDTSSVEDEGLNLLIEEHEEYVR